MFEQVQDKKPQSSSGLRLGVAVAAVLMISAIAFFTLTKREAQNSPEGASRSAAAPKSQADPVRDLKILRATMAKDPLGTTAIWSLTIENRSNTYTYTDIQYQTTYLGADHKPILVNKGAISASIDPGEQHKSDLRDTLYPAGTAFYNFVVTGATAKSQ